MKKDVAIEVTNLSKKYLININKDNYPTMRDAVMGIGKNLFKKDKKEEFWALKDINFEVKESDIVGIIGKNGAGKSTLLKVLSQIVEPTEGEVRLKGKIASLLEVGTGFNPELSGRENIYLNGAIIGMKRREIKDKFDEIVTFSGVSKFLDVPVKRYSSGMYIRLAFAVSAHLESDILLIDEVLSVGDAEFQKKCLRKMKNLAGKGRTVMFVSHNIDAIKSLCKKSILLKNGKIIKYDITEKVAKLYQQS